MSTFLSLNLCCGQSTGFGLTQSNYTIVESVYMNPANAADPKVYFDLHVFGAENTTTTDYLKFSAREYGKFNGIVPNNSDLYPKRNTLKLNTENTLIGPGFNYSIDRYSFGFTTAIREYININNLIPELATTYLKDHPEYKQRTSSITNIKFDHFKWEEIGIHAGAILYKQSNDMLTGGVNVKLMRPTMLSSMRIEELNYTANNNPTVTMNAINGQFARSTSRGRAGWGATFDVGFQYKKMEEGVTHYIPHSMRNNCKTIDYKYKLGFSILDVGMFTLNNNVEMNHFDAADVVLNKYEGIEENKVEDYVMAMRHELRSGFKDTLTQFSVAPPTAFSLQYDVKTRNHFYFNVSGLLAVNRKATFGPQRSSWISASYRYESAKFELASALNYNSVNELGLGAAVRLWVISIGTHNILPYLQNDAYSASFYFHARFNILKSNKCSGGSGTPIWRFSDCSGPKRDTNKGRNFKKNRKTARRNKRRIKKYRS